MTDTTVNLAPTTVQNFTIVETGAPTTTNPGDAPVSGFPTTPALARGDITGTGIDVSNNNRAHNCDICSQVDFGIAKQQLQQLLDVSGITAAAKSLFASQSGSPISENVQDIITTVKAEAKLVKQYTDAVSQQIQALQEYTKYIQDTIKEIESLPAELQGMYADCLSSLKSNLASSTTPITQSVSTTTSAVQTQVSSVSSSATNTVASLTPPTP